MPALEPFSEMKPNALTLSPVFLPEENLSVGGRQKARAFFDFVVDGRSLREMLRTPNIGVLSDDWDSRTAARELVLAEPVDGGAVDPEFIGHVLIYACRECGDVWCGGVAAKITRSGGRIRWAEISNYWINWGSAESAEHFVFDPADVGPFDFDFEQYRSTLKPFLD